jgi:PEP-CTERM motif
MASDEVMAMGGFMTISRILVSLLAAATIPASANAANIVVFYGDADFFGTGGNPFNPNISRNTPGDAPGTDMSLIGTGFGAPAFRPTGGFAPFSISGPVTSATLTIRFGSWSSGSDPVDPPNRIRLDGQTVPVAFLNLFSRQAFRIETLSFVLPSSFHPIFSDGHVSLAGTQISQDFMRASGSGFSTFQIDFLRLDLVTSDVSGAVPEPSSWAMMILGFGIIGLGLRRAQIAERARLAA